MSDDAPHKASRRQRILIISQVYVPDPAAVGQYMADAAEELARRGCEVRVLTARNGYEDPSRTYPARETREGVEVVRLRWSSFGKGSMLKRMIAQAFFVAQVTLRLLLGRRPDCVLVSTAPPMAGVAAVIAHKLRGVPVRFWVMDLNVDQLIANGTIKERSLVGRVLRGIVRRTFGVAGQTVVLDRFMQQRAADNYGRTENVHVLPPWPLDSHLEPLPHGENPFREEHGLQDKLVFMYSGNMGVGHPIGVLLEAARQLRDLEGVKFVFIGGGVRRAEIEQEIREHNPPNLLLLPYQPLDRLRYSLSAADVHLATMDASGLGYFHPCKVYGAMAVGRPILVAGPQPSHMTDLIDRYKVGWSEADDDPPSLVATVRKIVATPDEQLRSMGERARQAVTEDLGQQSLCGRFCDLVTSPSVR